MGQILRHWRVITATLFSVVLIFGAYMLARGLQNPQKAEASGETALLKAIASKDTDGDGLPDWEEALYGTNPGVADSFHLGMTDGEAVARGLVVPKAIADLPVNASSATTPSPAGLPPPPGEGTLIDAFSKKFFALYIQAKQANGGTDLSAADTNAIIDQALTMISSSVSTTPDFKSSSDLTVSGSGTEALKTFAEGADAILLKNTTSASTSELIYLQLALENNDAAALEQLTSISKFYRKSAVGFAALPAPAELAPSRLALVNAMMRLSEIVADFARVNSDAMTTMLALKQYVPAAQALANALIDIHSVYTSAAITLPAGTPGATFVNLARNAAIQRASVQKP